MKNIIIGIISIIVIVLLIGKIGYAETHYSIFGEVISIDNNEMLICDEEGEVWMYDIVNNLTIGDKVKLVMWNNTTDLDIYDDEIKEIIKIQ